MTSHDEPTPNELAMEAHKSEVDKRVRNQISQCVIENYPELLVDLLDITTTRSPAHKKRQLEVILTTFNKCVDDLHTSINEELADESLCPHCNGSGGGLPPMECTYCQGSGER